MLFRALDANGDWMFGQGMGSFATRQAATALNISTRLKSIKGDCFFAPQDGVDYRNLLEKGQAQNLKIAQANQIMQTPEVVKILSLNTSQNPKTRAFGLTAVIWTVYTKAYTATLDNLLPPS
jgi:hypothetical protein